MQRARPVLRFASHCFFPTRRCLMAQCTAVTRCNHEPYMWPSSGPETIAPEMVVIEVLPAADEDPHVCPTNGSSAADRASSSSSFSFSSSAAAASSFACGNPSAAGTALHQQHYWDVTRIDNFARSRVLNYVRRTAGNQTDDVFQVAAEHMDGRTVYRARCRLVLPAPHHLYVAEGIGEDAKDAELLAAMHAERVCDALGVPLFRLPSMQQKHAEAARREGRYAPMPGDPVRPEHTVAPPPLRMVRGASTRKETPTFGAAIAEAEIVDECHTRGGRLQQVTKRTVSRDDGNDNGDRNESDGSAAVDSKAHATDKEAAHGAVARAGIGWGEGYRDRYHTTVHYPWQSRHCGNSAHRSSGSHGITNISGGSSSNNNNNNSGMASSTNTATTAAAAAAAAAAATAAATINAFDPTEGGHWQMSNTMSTRCSPSPDALLLPCVYESAAYERLTDHFLQQGLVLRDRITVSHVAVTGHSTRMYVAEIRLFDSVVARGKAQTREAAEHLAAMHAELLLDALSRPLFPRDEARQAKHAEAAERFGRWAPNPLAGDLTHPRPLDPLPLPLKQQVGGDEVWLDPQMMMRRGGYQRSVGERLIAAHNEINAYCGDYIEANPDTALLAEARRVLAAWQREVARNPFPDLFVITRMGEQFRASTVVPVPSEFGTRGGNGVGKTMEQAIDLCALHAVDTLSALGIAVYADPAQQAQFIAQRRKAGLVTAHDMQGFSRGKGLVAILAPSLSEDKNNNDNNKNNNNNSQEGGERGMRTRPPYLPGYMVEGNQPRPLPHIRDTLRILQLRIPEDFTVYGEQLSDEAMVEVGNEAKVCVQNYLRHHMHKNANVNTSVYITGYGRQVSVHNIAYLPLVRPIKRETAAAAASQAAKKKKKKNASKDSNSSGVSSGVSDGNEESVAGKLDSGTAAGVGEVEKEELPGPSDKEESEERLLAVGISLKKKDAERACYLHAVDILRNIGQDVLTNYRAGLPRRKMASPPSPTTPTPPQQQQQQQQEQEHLQDKTQEALKGESSFPKPYMHKLMMQFMSSGRHYTAAKKRPPPGPFSPF